VPLPDHGPLRRKEDMEQFYVRGAIDVNNTDLLGRPAQMYSSGDRDAEVH
jgi:hypothetical protein